MIVMVKEVKKKYTNKNSSLKVKTEIKHKGKHSLPHSPPSTFSSVMEQPAGRPSKAEIICCLSKAVGFDQKATGFAKEKKINARVPLALPDLLQSWRLTGSAGSHFL